ncbi:MAG: hypothetical protein ABSD98_18650 [Candidatus Korobacteraceae bacterium]
MPTKSKPIRRDASEVRGPHRAARAQKRTKLSTTVAAENFAFLQALVNSGRTDSIAEAVDLAIARLRRAENRAGLERATAAYFDGLAPEAQAEEQRIARQLYLSAGGLDLDLEP